MNGNPARIAKWVAIVTLALVAGIFVFLRGGGQEGEKDSLGELAKSGRRGADFDRFSAIRSDANTIDKPAAIADETAQKALAQKPIPAPSPAPVANTVAVSGIVQPSPSPLPAAPAQKVVDCSSAWAADESCIKKAKPEPPHEVAAAPAQPEQPKPARSGVRLVKSETAQEPAPKPSSTHRPSAGGRQNLAEYEDNLVAMSSAKSNVVTGRAVKASTDILKKGSRYLGIINEAMVVYVGEKHDVTIDVISRLSKNTTVKPFLLYGLAELNKSGTRVMVTVTDCIAIDAAAESIPCKGVIQDHRGVTGLGGETYNPAHYANALKAVSSIVGGGFMALKTTSRTLNGGVLYDQTFGNGVLDALAGTAAEAGRDEAEEIKKEGKRVEIAPGAFVQVLIGEDVALW